MIRIYLFLLPKPTKIVLVNCCCNKNSQLCSCADACTFTGFIYSLLHDSGLFSHDFIPFFFSVHTLQSLSLLLCFHRSVSSSLSGPLTFSLIFLIQSLWSLYGADSWQTQLGFPMRAWQTSLPPCACRCWLWADAAVEKTLCPLALSKKKPLHHLDFFLRKLVALFFNALPLRLVIFQCHINTTSTLWDQINCGGRDGENKQHKLSNCLFNIKASTWLGSLSLQTWKTLCNEVSNSMSQNTVELAHLSSPPLCSAVGVGYMLSTHCLLWVYIDLSIGMLLLK